jgi:hypothetical protein
VVRDAEQLNAMVMNNSWGTTELPAPTYGDQERILDRLVRSPDGTTNKQNRLTMVFSAGNCGDLGQGAQTITRPKAAKNIIVVGACRNFKHPFTSADNISDLRPKSSRGPTADGRTVPHILAPGDNLVAAFATDRDDYNASEGTSGSAALVSGACALAIEWWLKKGLGSNPPSPAMIKALLINGAVDVGGGSAGGGQTIGHIPDPRQGWGRVNLKNTFRLPKFVLDQAHTFTASGQIWKRRVKAADPGRSLRITLAWTDAPGPEFTDTALANDLDLQVQQLGALGQSFLGNHFQNGWSVPGGAPDATNNVECVYIAQPEGRYDVIVRAGAMIANAFPPFTGAAAQDFAIVMDNAVEVP